MDKYYLLVDIDGTLSDASKRAKTYLEGDKPDWESFYMACGEDAPITPVIDIISTLSDHYDVVLCTGRSEICREITENWLHENAPGIFYRKILFRKPGDTRHDTEVKPEMLEAYMREHCGHKPVAIFEDRDSMVAKWRELGYTCFQPAAGNF